MITGDHLLIARNTAEQLDMGHHIFGSENLPLLDEETKKKPVDLSKNYGDLCLAADGFAQVYPEHKYLIVECLRELGLVIGMTGDGVNDAPALKRVSVETVPCFLVLLSRTITSPCVYNLFLLG
jgi:H+-transporting ATPase